MHGEATRAGKSSQQLRAIRPRVDMLVPEPSLRPLVPEGSLEEGTQVERQRAIAFWTSSREAVRR